MYTRCWSIVAGLLVLSISSIHASAQDPIRSLPFEFPVRAGVSDAAESFLYLAASEKARLFQVKLDTGTLENEITLPHRATQLEWSSDHKTLAALHGYDDAVSILSFPTLQVIATIPVGEQPTDIAATAGGFVVVNAFSRTVSFIDSETYTASEVMRFPDAFPAKIVVVDDRYIVATRKPNQLITFAWEGNQKLEQIELPDTPLSLEALTDNQVIVHLRSGAHRFNIDEQTLDPIETETHDSVTARDGKLIVLPSGELLLITKISPPKIVEQPGKGRINPAAKKYFEAPHRPNPDTIKTTRRRVTPLPPEDQSVLTTETHAHAEPTPIKQTKLDVAPGWAPLGFFVPYAPSLGDRAPIPIEELLNESSFFFPNQESLLNIDVAQPARDLDTNTLKIGPNFETIEATGGTSFIIDDAQFIADSFTTDQATGLTEINGDVSVISGEATLHADSLRLQRFEPDGSQPDALVGRPLIPFGETIREPGVLERGKFEAHNFDLTEVNRSLSSDFVILDSINRTGEIRNPLGHSEPIYFGAESIRILGPESYEAHDLWITTCDLDDPHYRIRIAHARVENGRVVEGKNARLQLGDLDTPLYIPRLSATSGDGAKITRIDFDSGSETAIGSFLNLGQWYAASPNVDLGLRTYLTSREGIGLGLDSEYNFMDEPTSPLFRGKGQFESLYTTKERGYHQWYHQQSLGPQTEMRAQWEQWYDPEFVKDFYIEDYENRSGPRSFLNVTHLRPGSIWTVTASKSTHAFTDQTEKLPEGSFHLLERSLGKNLYLSMDSFAGSYNETLTETSAQRVAQSARLTYDWNVTQGFNIAPFVEGGATYYSDTLVDDDSDTRWTSQAGVTAQTRFSRSYRGFGGFDSFKHIIIPSVTYLHQESSGLMEIDVPRFDSIDKRPTRERVESKIENIVLGRNRNTEEIWRVARFALYQGYDISNDAREATDYEIDLEVRPRPWWGVRALGETHDLVQNQIIPGEELRSVLTYLFYDDGKFENSVNGQLGYTFTQVDGMYINREVLYGAGYKFSPNWSVAFQQRYDIELDDLTRQSYEIRRRLHKWDVGFRVRDRETGTDFSIMFSLIDIDGATLRF